MKKYYKNTATGEIKASPITLNAPAKDKAGNAILNDDGTPKMVKLISNSEAVLTENGWEPYTPPVAKIDPARRVRTMRFNKRKVKGELVRLGLWEEAKAMLTESEYEDLVLSERLDFSDPLFVRVYDALKAKIADIDELLLKCGA